MDLQSAAGRIGDVRSALIVSVAVGSIALLPGSAGEAAGWNSFVGAALPAPITITAGHASYRIGRDGDVSRARVARGVFPSGASWFPGTGTWFMFVHGHLLVGRERTTLWRSASEIAAGRLGVIAAGPDAVAFQMRHRLYLARYGGPTRAVADRELPLGWTADGLYTYSYPRRQLLLRSDTGALVQVIARRPREYDFDLASRSLYFIDGGAIGGAHGSRTWRLGSLVGRGMSRNTWLVPVGRLIELEDDQRIVLLRPSGAEFASTALPRIGRDVSSPDSSLAVSPDRSAIAFSAPFGQSHVTEVAYLLHAGAHAAVPIHTERGLRAICARWADLGWRGRWLLYSDTQGRLAAIDTARADRTIELSGLVHRLLGETAGLSARWSG